jgi:hypothetical protein
MSIRIRKVNGITIALCAVETDPKEGDIYLDDAIHYALATKFSEDWKGDTQTGGDSVLVSLMEQEKVRDAQEVSIELAKKTEKESLRRGYSVLINTESAAEEFRKYGRK